MYFNQLMFLLPIVDSKDSLEDDGDEIIPETKTTKTKTSVTDLAPYYSATKTRKTHEKKTSVTDLVPYSVPKRFKVRKREEPSYPVANGSNGSSSETAIKDCNSVEVKTTDCDEDRDFAMSLVPMLRRLGEYDKLDVKLQILTLFKSKCSPPPVRNANNMADKLVQTKI